MGKQLFKYDFLLLDNDFVGEVKIDSSNIGFMFQDSRLIPWLNIKENLLVISKIKI